MIRILVLVILLCGIVSADLAPGHGNSEFSPELMKDFQDWQTEHNSDKRADLAASIRIILQQSPDDC